MTSEVDICNQALAAIGTRSTIASLSEQSNEAIQCALQYASTRDQLLRSAPWNFVRAYANLSVLKSAPGTPEYGNTVPPTYWDSTLPPPPWLYEYAYPSDCLWARAVMAQYPIGTFDVPIFSSISQMPMNYGGTPVPFVVASDKDENNNSIKVILTNTPNAILLYNRAETDPNMFDSEFVIALINGVAANIVIPLTGSLQLRNALLQEANGYIAQTRAVDGNEGLTVQDTYPDWLRVRGQPAIGTGFDFYGMPFYNNWGPMLT